MSIWRTLAAPYFALRTALAEKRSRRAQRKVLEVLADAPQPLTEVEIAWLSASDVAGVDRALFELRDEYDPPRVETVLVSKSTREGRRDYYRWRLTDAGREYLEGK